MDRCAEGLSALLGKPVAVKLEQPTGKDETEIQAIERAICNSTLIKSTLNSAILSTVNRNIARTLIAAKLNTVLFVNDSVPLVTFDDAGSLILKGGWTDPYSKTDFSESVILKALDSKLGFVKLDAIQQLKTKILPSFDAELTSFCGSTIQVDLDWKTFATPTENEDLQKLTEVDGRLIKESVITPICRMLNDEHEKKIFSSQIKSVILAKYVSSSPLDAARMKTALEQNRWSFNSDQSLTFQLVLESNSVSGQGSLLASKLRTALDTAINFSVAGQKTRVSHLLGDVQGQLNDLFAKTKADIPEIPLAFELDLQTFEKLSLEKQLSVLKDVPKVVGSVLKAFTVTMKDILASDVCREVLEKPEGTLGLEKVLFQHVSGAKAPKEVKLENRILTFKVPFEEMYAGDYWGSKIGLALEDTFHFQLLKAMKSVKTDILPHAQEELETLLGLQDVVLSIDWDSILLSEPAKQLQVLNNISRDKLDFVRHAAFKAIKKIIELDYTARSIVREQLQEIVVKNVPGDSDTLRQIKFSGGKLILTSPFESSKYRLSWTEVEPYLDRAMDISLKRLPLVYSALLEKFSKTLESHSLSVEFDGQSVTSAIGRKNITNEDEKKGLTVYIYERLVSSDGQLIKTVVEDCLKKEQFALVRRIVLSCEGLSTVDNVALFNKDTGVLSVSLLLTLPAVSHDLTPYKLLHAIDNPNQENKWKPIEVSIGSSSQGVSHYYGSGYRSSGGHSTYYIHYGRSLATVTTLRCGPIRHVRVRFC